MIDAPDERKQFAALITGTSDYYNKAISKMAIRVYWNGLRQYDFEAIEKAMFAHTERTDEQGRWMPLVADIKTMIEGRTVDKAALAWSKVDSAVRQIGTYADVVFDDATIHRVLADMGGWIALGNKKEDDWPFVAKEFCTRYQGYRMRGEAPEYAPVLIGMANAFNGQEGYSKQEPRLIGNADLCAVVRNGGRALIGMQKIAPKQIGGAA